jgi:hypothetical protein
VPALWYNLAVQRTCEYCGAEMEAQRVTKRFCSVVCAQRKARGWPKTRSCRHCGSAFQVRERADANRQHCSKACAKNHNAKIVGDWRSVHPDSMTTYNRTRLAKNPGAWREKSRSERAEIIAMLGGRCIVCGASNPVWLHADYIPTTRDRPFRHPRHIAFVRVNASDFRVLCANHHYELTLTGRIEGTDITQ